MTYTGEVSLGSILMIVTMSASVVSIVVGVRVELSALKSTLTDLSLRLARHEAIVFEMAGHMQNLIGQMTGYSNAQAVQSAQARHDDRR